MRVRNIVLGVAVLILAVAGLLPVAVMTIRSVTVGGHLTFTAYRGLLGSPRQWVLVRHSLTLATLTTLGALALGVPAGLVVGRTDLPGRRTLMALLSMPLLLPPYLTAVGWMTAGSDRGPVARLCGPAVAHALTGILFGLPGCVLVLTTAFMPLVMILTAAALGSVPSRLEEAGLTVAAWPTVLWRISLPLVAPGILLGAALVFLLSLGDVSVAPSLRYPVFAVESLSQFSAFYDLTAATAAAMPLALLTAAVLGLEALLGRQRGVRFQAGLGSGHARTVRLGRLRGSITLAAWTCAVVLVGIPLTVLAVEAGGAHSYAMAFQQAGDSVWRSLGLAAAGGTLLAAEGYLLAILARERAHRTGAAADAAALFLFAVPGPVMGVGLIVLWNRPWANMIYATPAILLLGYLARYSAITLRLNRAALDMVPERIVEAGRTVGAGWGRRLFWIVAPSTVSGIAAAWLAGAVFSLRDVGMTLLVHPPGWDTLPVRIMTLAANGAPSLIAALCIILVVTTVIPVGALSLVLGRRGGSR